MKRFALPLAVPLLAGLLFAVTLLGACAKEEASVAPYNASCLWNIQQARNYTAQGRYELAREHYLLALSASDESRTRRIIANELKSVDTMIKTLR